MPKNNLKRYMGINPGKARGIVTIDGKDVSLYVMPNSLCDLWCLFDNYLYPKPVALLERVSASPQMGDTSAFTFGRGFGNLEMALTGNGILYEEVTPVIWQRRLHIPPRRTRRGETPRQFKERLRQKAQKLFPDLYIWSDWAKTDQLKVCDALLIAEYLRRREEGKL